MKRADLSLGVILVAISCLLTFSGCGKGDDPSAADQVKSILTSGTWNLQSTTVDGVDQSSVYTGLTLRFTDTNFTSTNGRVVWPASGTWQFTDDTGKAFTRNDDLLVTIETATTSQLVLKLTWNQTTLGSGRVGSVKGVNTFTFGK